MTNNNLIQEKQNLLNAIAIAEKGLNDLHSFKSSVKNILNVENDIDLIEVYHYINNKMEDGIIICQQAIESLKSLVTIVDDILNGDSSAVIKMAELVKEFHKQEAISNEIEAEIAEKIEEAKSKGLDVDPSVLAQLAC